MVSRKFGKIAVTVILCALFSQFFSTATAGQVSRSLVDRPDDISGYQIHLVYVALKGSTDSRLDTSAKVESWTKEANAWLQSYLGHDLIFDTYQGKADISFMRSRFTPAALCRDTCDALSKLESEYQAQDASYNGTKTLVFIVNEKLSETACGWSMIPGNLVILNDISSQRCNTRANLPKTGLSWLPHTLAHELFHSYGIHHQCFNASDLMIGSPECKINKATYDRVPLTMDATKSHYLGSDASDGIDLLQMPIWSDESGDVSYSQIKQISDSKYIPQLKDGTVFAVLGRTTKKFDWAWDKKFSPQGKSISCQFVSGTTLLAGRVEKSGCIFDVPASLRPGTSFTVNENWNMGPWHGTATIDGTLVRTDLTASPCTEFACFIGGSTTAHQSCWDASVTQMTLQQFVNNQWVDQATVDTVTANKRCTNQKFQNAPIYQLNFTETGTFIYRWFIPARPGYVSTIDKPFAVIVNEETSPESTQADASAALAQALKS